MAEYIEREAALAMSFCTAPATMINPYGGDSVVRVEDIENLPAADVVKRERGEWKVYFSYGCWHYDCPFCGDGYATKERQKCPTNFCGECGADLRPEGGADSE